MTVENPNLDASSPENLRNLKLRRLAATASVSVAVILVLLKMVSYMMTESVSMLTSLTDSMIDAIASGITLLSIFRASAPADRDHRYGHGKIESLAAVAQAVFILASAGYLALESINRFVNPIAVTDIDSALWVMGTSLVLTTLLIVGQNYTIKRTNSVAIKADSLHYTGDLLMNAGVIVSLLLSKYSDSLYFDPAFGMIIALVLLRSAYMVAQEAAAILMDKELSEGDRHTIEILVMAHPKSKAIHDLRTRFSGNKTFIEFHLEVDGNLTLAKAHDVTEDLEREIYKIFPDADVAIHQEPFGIQDYRHDSLINKQKD